MKIVKILYILIFVITSFTAGTVLQKYHLESYETGLYQSFLFEIKR